MSWVGCQRRRQKSELTWKILMDEEDVHESRIVTLQHSTARRRVKYMKVAGKEACTPLSVTTQRLVHQPPTP
jgi:hypothetical protein